MQTINEMAMEARTSKDKLVELWNALENYTRKLVNKYYSFCVANCAIDLDDLVQSAFIALTFAVEKFDAQQDCKFTTFYAYCLKSAAQDILGLKGRVRREHYKKLSIYSPIDPDSDTTIEDVIPDTSIEDEDTILDHMACADCVRDALARLDPTEAGVIAAEYGISGNHRVDGFTKEELRRIHARAVRHLRQDRKLKMEWPDYSLHVGIESFNTTWTSAVEHIVIRRDELLNSR